ncbi:phage replisome organizer N-terminal domain-containing protein [Sporosarcina sp. P33]|uniref:phage replisome organizer N-terminal domain-containing protein n=1 Tax=Sporosarcina sp. P33 TaxID=1930764 RepID=UPI0009BCEE2E|nr:phage replisome organizer N-terminal domain-containing protein [Sporosarcina sp. P33]ARD47599.1 replication protein [Sporosarcina sp. P33]
MADVKWIKLSVSMFDDEKIKLIEQMPEADTLLVIWLKLLAQAGKTNASGYIYLSENIPYTEEMLAAIFHRPLATVRLALKTFKDFGMLELDEHSYLSIANWEKHQNIDGLEKMRKQTRERVARHRQLKAINAPSKNVDKNVTLHSVTGNETVTNGNATELELELEKNKKEIIPFVEIINYLNNAASANYRSTTRKTKDLIQARWNEGFRLEDFYKVIDIKTKEWINDSKMSKFIRPDTLFGTKFESYLNQKEVSRNAETIGRDEQRNGKPKKIWSDGVNF